MPESHTLTTPPSVTGSRSMIRVLGLSSQLGLPDYILSAQLTAARRSVPPTLLATGCAILVLLASFRHDPNFSYLVAAASALVATLAVNWIIYAGQKARNFTYPVPRRANLQISILSFLTALCWGALLSIALLEADGEYRLLLMCVIVGVTAAGVLNVAALPSAGLSFLAGSLFSNGIQIFIVGGIPLAILPLLGVFAVILSRSIFDQALLFVEYVESSAALLEESCQRETITIAAQKEREQFLIAAQEERQRAERAEEIAQQKARGGGLGLRRADMVLLAERFELSVGDAILTLSDAAISTETSAGTLTSWSLEHAADADLNVKVAQRTADLAATLTTSALELKRSVSDIASQVEQQAELTAGAECQARESETAIFAMVDHAVGIEKIVLLISEIARQTNLLALNASIEAARAGDAGRGFAIVASEVQELANQTRRATESVSMDIGGMQSRVQNAAETLRAITSDVRKVARLADHISDAIRDQNDLAALIATDAGRAAHEINILRTGVESGARGAEMTHGFTIQVSDASNLVKHKIGCLRADADELLAELRAT